MVINLMNDLLPVGFFFFFDKEFLLVYSEWFKTHIMAHFCGATRVFTDRQQRRKKILLFRCL